MNDLLVAIPDRSTQEFLTAHLQGAPFEILPKEKWFAPIFASKTELPPEIVKAEVTYYGSFLSASLWYDAMLGYTNLVLVFQSDEMNRRHLELLNTGFPPKIPSETYSPHITLVYGMPPITRTNKSFINSLPLAMKPKYDFRFVFDTEVLLESNGYVPNLEGQKYFTDAFFD